MEQGMMRRGLTETGLKWIALVCMVLDHIHYFFGWTGVIPEWFSMVGRLGAPLFLFCLVEGFTHTHDRRRYFLKVYIIGGLMSLLLFFMQFGGFLVRPDGFYPMNSMMTTFAILMVIYQGMDWLGQKKFGRGLAAVVLPLLWPFLAAWLLVQMAGDTTILGILCYSVVPMWGVTGDSSLPVLFVGIVLYAFRKNRVRQVLAFVLVTLLYDVGVIGWMAHGMPGFHWTQMFTMYYEWYGVFAAIPMLCYNGQRGSGHKKLFYAFYPAHIYILYALSWMTMIVLGKA